MHVKRACRRRPSSRVHLRIRHVPNRRRSTTLVTSDQSLTTTDHQGPDGADPERRAYERIDRYLGSLVYPAPRSRESREAIGLSVMRKLLARLGNPQTDLRVIHVAGSKGKGSTVLIAEALLRHANLRVGSYTSPHLERWTERIRIDGQEITPTRMLQELESIGPQVEALARGDPENAPTFFEVLTAAALSIFRKQELDWVLLETGLGGRLDATNVVSPLAACVTSLELEHTDRLGPHISDIAREKAGVAKPGIPLVLGAMDQTALAVMSQVATDVGARLVSPGAGYRSEIRTAEGTGPRICLETNGFHFAGRLARTGGVLAGNVVIALTTLVAAGALTGTVLSDAATRILPTLQLPGRCELLPTTPAVLIDSAHTEASAAALAEEVKRLGLAPVHLVLSLSAARNLNPLIRVLGEIGDPITVCRAEQSRSLPPELVADALRTAYPLRQIHVTADPAEALVDARAGVPDDGLLCVAGSVYMSGAARGQFARSESS